jgi:hypothetical protein
MLLNRFVRRFALSDEDKELIATASKSEKIRLWFARMPYLLLSDLIGIALFVAAMYVLITRGLAIGIAVVVLAEVVSLLVFALLLLPARRSVLNTLDTFEGARHRGIAPDDS